MASSAALASSSASTAASSPSVAATTSCRSPVISKASEADTADGEQANSAPSAASEHEDGHLEDQPVPDLLASESTSHADHIVHRGPCRKGVVREPWFVTPQSGNDLTPWMARRFEATEWTALFYDLVVVAVLSGFGKSHHISSPDLILSFAGYFIIIYWTWVSQTHYDMRYQTSDMLHRLFKFFQIILFIYIGAASGKWDLTKLRIPESLGYYGAAATKYISATESFTTTVIAFIISRILLGCQYAIAAIAGRRVGRRTNRLYISVATLLLSSGLGLAAVLIKPYSKVLMGVKLGAFYLGIAIEIGAFLVQINRRIHIPADCEKVSERYGAFTLIVLGEGIIILVSTFSKALGLLSGKDANVYAQAFMSALTIYLLYCFLFDRFDKHDDVGEKRVLWWEVIHFPLYFALLLLLFAMIVSALLPSSSSAAPRAACYGVQKLTRKNYILLLSNLRGTATVLADFGNALQDSTDYTQQQYDAFGRYLNRLGMQPTLEAEIKLINAARNSPDPNSDDPEILTAQYLGQIFINAFEAYDFKLSSSVYTSFDDLLTLNTSRTENSTFYDERNTQITMLLSNIINTPYQEIFTGVVWLYPAAGGVLIVSAIRSLIYYRFPSPAHLFIHLPPLIFGCVLSILGLLDIGSRRVEFYDSSDDDDLNLAVNPFYRAMLSEVALVAVVGTYILVWVTSNFGLRAWNRFRPGVFVDEIDGGSSHGGHLECGEKSRQPVRQNSGHGDEKALLR